MAFEFFLKKVKNISNDRIKYFSKTFDKLINEKKVNNTRESS